MLLLLGLLLLFNLISSAEKAFQGSKQEIVLLPCDFLLPMGNQPKSVTRAAPSVLQGMRQTPVPAMCPRTGAGRIGPPVRADDRHHGGRSHGAGILQRTGWQI